MQTGSPYLVSSKEKPWGVLSDVTFMQQDMKTYIFRTPVKADHTGQEQIYIDKVNEAADRLMKKLKLIARPEVNVEMFKLPKGQPEADELIEKGFDRFLDVEIIL